MKEGVGASRWDLNDLLSQVHCHANCTNQEEKVVNVVWSQNGASMSNTQTQTHYTPQFILEKNHHSFL